MSLSNSPFWFASGATSSGGGVTPVYPYSLDQSLRIPADNHQLDKTYGTAGNQKTWTFSCWVKRSELGTTQNIFTPYTGGDGSNEAVFRFNSSDHLNIYDSGANRGQVTTKAKFRDPSAWYHIVVVLDITRAGSKERIKIFVNGEEQELTINNSIGTSNWGWNGAKLHRLGGYARNTTSNFVGYLAEVHMIDGTVLGPDDFGEYNKGVWVPKETSGLTYGTNGFYFSFVDTKALGRDKSGSQTLITSRSISTIGGGTTDMTNPEDGFNLNLTDGPNRVGTGGLVEITPSSSYTPVKHRIINRDSSSYSAGSRPGVVYLQGSNDGGTTWTNLDNFTASSGAGAVTEATFSNTTSYAKLRLNITSNGGGTDTRFAEYMVWGSENNGDGDNVYFNNNENLSEHDVVPDSPTNNYCTMTSLPSDYISQITFAEGNLKCQNSTVHKSMWATFAITSGKWYWEADNAGGNKFTIGLNDVNNTIYKQDGGTNNIVGYTPSSSYANGDAVGLYAGTLRKNGSTIASSLGYATGDKMAIAFDADAGKLWFRRNGTWFNGSGTDSTTLDPNNHDTTVTTGEAYVPVFSLETPSTWVVNFGQDSTFAGAETAGGNADENGEGDFFYAVPSGFLALCSKNLPDPTFGANKDSGEQPDNYFEAITYTGNGAVQHIGSGGAHHPVDVTTIANSIKFNDSDNAFLNRTLTSSDTAATDRKIGTISFWFKRGATGTLQTYLMGNSDGNGLLLQTNSSNQWYFYDFGFGSGGWQISKALPSLEDTFQWNHFHLKWDTTQSTDSDRITFTVNGEVQDLSSWSVGGGASRYPTQNAEIDLHTNAEHRIAAVTDTSANLDGYLAEYYVLDGTAENASTFGQYGSNGYWIPKAPTGLTFGNRGWYLDFEDNSTASALGTDDSGNGKDFSVTNVATTDQMIDTPTQNFSTIDPNTYGVISSSATLSEGNLKVQTAGFSSTLWGGGFSTFAIPYGMKVYIEICEPNDAGDNWGAGICTRSATPGSTNTGGAHSITVYNRSVMLNGIENDYGASAGLGGLGVAKLAAGDILGIAVDGTTGEVWFHRNGTYFKTPTTDNSGTTGDPANGNYPIGIPNRDGKENLFLVLFGGTGVDDLTINFGQDDSFSGAKTSGSASASDSNGKGSFYYTPPTGFLALVDDNIPVTGIDSPDLIWIKNRSNARESMIYDIIRGPNNDLRPSSTDEGTTTNGLLSFDKQGFTVGDKNNLNGNGETIVAWTWKASGGDSTFNIDGTGYSTAGDAGLTGGNITPTGCSINTSAGFSIIRYTGNGSLNQTIKHGLSEAPEMIWNKDRDPNSNNNGWWIANTIRGDDYIQFHTTNGFVGASPMYPTSGDDTTITVGRNSPVANSNESGDDYIQYHWHSVEGFSKVGIYGGTGSTSGGFVYTGFRPAWVMIKSTASGTDWCFYDNKRLGYNVDNNLLRACSGSGVVEQTDDDIDFVSNGFKLRRNSSNFNSSGVVYTYFAMAQQPFKYANAR